MHALEVIAARLADKGRCIVGVMRISAAHISLTGVKNLAPYMQGYS
jgi:phosphoserine aminotransferase